MSDPVLPPLYDAWLTPLIGDVPAETRATCDDCAMCDKSEGRAAASYSFLPDVKCCVYQPDLPNFLVGRILVDEDLPHGLASLERRIDHRVGVTPWGIRATPTYALLFHNTVNAIGRMTSLRCPHFVTGTGACGIHRHRNHLCSTWYCKHERGRIGYTFWQAMKQLLESIEEDLARWCALELDLSPMALSLIHGKRKEDPIDASEIEGTLSEEVYQMFWGNWANQERAFYLECAKLIEDFDGEAVMEICGPTTRVYLEVARAAWKRLVSKDLPATLSCGSYELLGVHEDGVSAMTYSSTDPIGIPAAVQSVLHLFDGSPTGEILQRIVDERGLKLEDDLIGQLVDWGVLR